PQRDDGGRGPQGREGRARVPRRSVPAQLGGHVTRPQMELRPCQSFRNSVWVVVKVDERERRFVRLQTRAFTNDGGNGTGRETWHRHRTAFRDGDWSKSWATRSDDNAARICSLRRTP